MMNENSTGLSAADIAAVTGNHGCSNGWGFGGDWMSLLVLFLFASMFGYGGYGGFGGGFGGNGRFCNEPCATQSDVRAAVDQQTLISKLDQQTYGLADSTYALNNAISNGFHGVSDGINGISHQLSDCCCSTQRLIERGFADTNYNMATQACETRNTIQNSTRDIIDATNANYRGLMDFLVQEKLSAKDMMIAQLQNQVSQSQQNAVLMAAMDANKAEILRRTGSECPTAAYLVQPPTPVNFPVNGCGQVQFHNGFGGGCGCGCGNF
jgi:hypothetical protein